MLFHIDPSMMDTGEAFAVEISGIPFEEEYNAEYTFAGPVELKARGMYISGGVEMEGTVTGVINVQCARCLKEFGYPVSVDFREFFGGDDRLESYPIDEGDNIPLDRMILEAISLSLPNRFLCREDCKGLCPVCGHDLNEGDCGCGTNKETDSPFNVLKGLFDTDKEV